MHMTASVDTKVHDTERALMVTMLFEADPVGCYARTCTGTHLHARVYTHTCTLARSAHVPGISQPNPNPTRTHGHTNTNPIAFGAHACVRACGRAGVRVCAQAANPMSCMIALSPPTVQALPARQRSSAAVVATVYSAAGDGAMELSGSGEGTAVAASARETAAAATNTSATPPPLPSTAAPAAPANPVQSGRPTIALAAGALQAAAAAAATEEGPAAAAAAPTTRSSSSSTNVGTDSRTSVGVPHLAAAPSPISAASASRPPEDAPGAWQTHTLSNHPNVKHGLREDTGGVCCIRSGGRAKCYGLLSVVAMAS